MYWLETIMQGLDTMMGYGDGSVSAGMIVAEVIGLIFVVGWCILAYETKVLSEENMSGDKKQRFVQSRQKKIVRAQTGRNKRNENLSNLNNNYTNYGIDAQNAPQPIDRLNGSEPIE